jgi:hypothetical protein
MSDNEKLCCVKKVKFSTPFFSALKLLNICLYILYSLKTILRCILTPFLSYQAYFSDLRSIRKKCFFGFFCHLELWVLSSPTASDHPRPTYAYVVLHMVSLSDMCFGPLSYGVSWYTQERSLAPYIKYYILLFLVTKIRLNG